MTGRFQLFVSSVQNELEDERLIVQNLLNTDTFLFRKTRRPRPGGEVGGRAFNPLPPQGTRRFVK